MQTSFFTFSVNATTAWGEQVYIIGSIPELGSWNPANAIGPASSENYPIWSFTKEMPVGVEFEFKAIKKDASGKVVWEGGNNHIYDPTKIQFSWQN